MVLSHACWMHACAAEAHVDAAPTDDSANEGAPRMDAHLSADEQTLYFSRDRTIWSVPFARCCAPRGRWKVDNLERRGMRSFL